MSRSLSHPYSASADRRMSVDGRGLRLAAAPLSDGLGAAVGLHPDRHLGGRRSREDGRDYGPPDHRPYIQHFAGSAAVEDEKRLSEVCGYGQLKRFGRRSCNAAASDSRSCMSPVRIGSERRAATTTRWASTTSLVPERASRLPTSGPSSKATTTTDCRNLARRAWRTPSRHTWATTGCVVVSGVSWTSAAVRNSCAARSPRSTEMRNPASRIKAVAIGHRRHRIVLRGACLAFPVAE